jgi:hypothetical protein
MLVARLVHQKVKYPGGISYRRPACALHRVRRLLASVEQSTPQQVAQLVDALGKALLDALKRS